MDHDGRMMGQARAMAPVEVRVLTLGLAGLDEAAVAPLLPMLDEEERRRATRFTFAHSRVEFTAAHALARAALAAATGAPPAAFRYRPGPYGKPEALLEDGHRSAPVSFNLSHTDGLVGVAVAAAPGLRLGFDLEALERRVTPRVARGVYRPEELAWLAAQPGEDAWRLGFLRLWTLKESFIKATGRGLGQGLSTFWFALDADIEAPPAIRFVPPGPERPEEWVFAQRLLGDGCFLGAVGLHRGGAAGHDAVRIEWEDMDLPRLRQALGFTAGG
jgi:4'-phosphopantetheinyl transferase